VRSSLSNGRRHQSTFPHCSRSSSQLTARPRRRRRPSTPPGRRARVPMMLPRQKSRLPRLSLARCGPRLLGWGCICRGRQRCAQIIFILTRADPRTIPSCCQRRYAPPAARFTSPVPLLVDLWSETLPFGAVARGAGRTGSYQFPVDTPGHSACPISLLRRYSPFCTIDYGSRSPGAKVMNATSQKTHRTKRG
jgi:hypothetical protein